MGVPGPPTAIGAEASRPGSPGVRALAAGCVAIAWPGALIFAYPGVMARHWQETLGLSRAAVGGTLFFVLAAVGATMFLVGRWQERVPPRRLVLAGEVLTAGSLLFTAFPAGAWSLYLWGLAVGAASCFVYLPALTVAQLWFPQRRGLASGVVNLAFAGSAAVAAPALEWAVGAVGHPATHGLLALAILAFGGAAARGVTRPASRAAAGVPTGRSLTPAEGMKTRAFWCLWLAWALQGAAGIAMVTLAVPLGLSKGLSDGAAVGVLTAFNAANGLSRLVMGLLSDRAGRRLILCATFAAAGGAYLALPGVGGPGGTAALAAVVGVAFGTLFAVSAPLVVECFGPAHFGAVFGLVFTAYGFLSGLLGPWLSGALLDRAAGDPGSSCLYLGACSFAAAVLMLGVRPPGSTGGSR